MVFIFVVIRNIFLTKDDDIKLGDMGSAKEMKTVAINQNTPTFAGTIVYMSPDIWDLDYSYNTDIWLEILI